MKSNYYSREQPGPSSSPMDKLALVDHGTCGCDCEQIKKYKEKAHKSFMQVVEVEQMYKEEIEQLCQKQEQIISSIKAENERQLSKVRKDYEQKIEKLRGEKEVIQARKVFEAPFVVDDIESIGPTYLDESIDSVSHLRDFVTGTSLQELTTSLKSKIHKNLRQLKYGFSSDQSHVSSLSQMSSQNSERKNTIDKLLQQINQIFQVVSTLFETTATSSEKYNKLSLQCSEAETLKQKYIEQNQRLRKETQFMKQYIQKLTQDKMKLDRKCNELDRVNKIMEKTVFDIRKETEHNKKSKTNQKQKTEGQHIQIYADEDSDNDNSDGEVVIDNSRLRGTTYSRTTYTPKAAPKPNHFMRDLHFRAKKDVNNKEQ